MGFQLGPFDYAAPHCSALNIGAHGIEYGLAQFRSWSTDLGNVAPPKEYSLGCQGFNPR
ncbi:MAG: hypothetical protein OS130_01760 [Thermodesulfobacteriota bacterium]|nr:MAG: hypothetical protein OS130_01760 [Thermodesulfobacteriota bacterium]